MEASLFFYDTVPGNGLGGIAWAGLLPAPSQVSIDAFGNVDGMDFAGPPPLTGNFNVFGWADRLRRGVWISPRGWAGPDFVEQRP